MRAARASLAALALAASTCLGCGNNPRDTLAIELYDAGLDATDARVDAPSDSAVDATDLGSACVDDPQCDDGVACTFDQCDPVLHRCRNIPDDSACDDGIYCNGKERCVVHHGCEAGFVVTCSDNDPCTIDRCVESTKSCAHTPRDMDSDGDPDDHCVPKHDCNDLDPQIASTHAEVCSNGKDDNCNGLIDENPCVTAAHDVCATALAISAPGTYAMTTVAARKDYATSCSVSSPAAAEDIVAAITIPAGGAKDLQVWATTQSGEVAVALEGTCGASTSELACGSGVLATKMRALARRLTPGTYYAIITTQSPGDVEVEVDMLDPTTPPTNESCSTPQPITPNAAIDVSIVNPAKNLPSACTTATSTGELTYAFTLAQPADVRVFAPTTRGSGAAIVGLRSAHCTDAADETTCRIESTGPLFARSLAAGTWIVTLAGTSTIDVSLLVATYPPTATPANQTCTAPPPLASGVSIPVDLSNQASAIADGCLAGSPDAAYDLTLATTSDVLVVGRFAGNAIGAVSIDNVGCTPTDQLVCGTGSTPVRITKRALLAGDYRVVIADTEGAVDSLVAYVRDTVAPTIVTDADSCTSPVVDIPQAGGFFTGDTTSMHADFDDACDGPTGPGGAPDQILRLVLAHPQHVIFDMDGSTYTTILDIRQGDTCPGIEVPGDCYVGFAGPRSFLDVNLDAGTYWVVIDGFLGSKGPWNLDVRVLPP